MATNTCTLTGHFVRPNDADLSGGRVELELNDYDMDSGEVISTALITANLDSGGNMSVPVWPAQRGQRGTYYNVTLIWKTSAGEARQALGHIQPPDDGTADIWGLLDAPLSVGAVYWSSLTQEEYQATVRDNAVATIADDDVAEITPPRNAGFAFITVRPENPFANANASGLVLFDVGASPNLVKIGGGANFDVVNTDVAGTTGTDDHLTVGGADGNLRIENRTGGDWDVRISFI